MIKSYDKGKLTFVLMLYSLQTRYHARHLISFASRLINEPRHEIFQQCGILTSVDSDEPVQPPFKLRNSINIQSVA